jgi:CheY-like chemotaxis protein
MPHRMILYAEDNATVRLAVKDWLEREGWAVETCADGASALERILSGARYDLLLLDNELERGPSGIELTGRARTLAQRRATPVIIISASEVGREARLAGADLFLRKPEDISRVAECIERLLGGHGGE